MKNFLLGIDIGTSSCKAAVFDFCGNAVVSRSADYKTYYPQKFFAEQNPNEWWESVCAAIRLCISDSGIESGDIAAVGIAGQSWACVPVGSGGDVLHNSPIWLDTRAKAICEKALVKTGGERIFQTSGNPFTPTYSTPKILWFRQHMPEAYNKTRFFLQSNSYIVYKLTGEVSQDESQGYGLHVYDIRKGIYDETLAEELGIDTAKLPPISKCTHVIGTVTEAAAKMTGLAVGTPVAAGGLDAACSTLGAGAVKNGQTQEQGGQAGGMSICLDRPLPHRKLILSRHVVEGMWLLQGGTVGGGGTLNWFVKELGFKEEQEGRNRGISPFEILGEEAQKAGPGAEGLIFLPYMAGERSPLWDEKAKGVFFGLSYDKTRAHMVRAVMEGVAFSLRHNVETAKDAGAEIRSFRSVGGSANSEIWTQIKADVTGIPIDVAKSDTATTWGAAMLAGVGAGIYKSPEEALGKSVVLLRHHEPDMDKHKQYEKYYLIYLELYDKLKDTMGKI